MILVVGDLVDDIGVRPLGTVNPASDTVSEIRMTAGGSAANVAAWLGHLGADVRFVGRCGADGVERHTRGPRGVRRGRAHHRRPRPADRDDRPDPRRRGRPDDVRRPGRQHDPDGRRRPGRRLGRRDLAAPDGLLVLRRRRAPGRAATSSPRRSAATIGVSIDPSSLGFLEAAGRDTVAGLARGRRPGVPQRRRAGLPRPGRRPGRADPRRRRGGVPRPTRCRALPTDVVDTTGAGDAFCAGFLADWTRTGDVESALRSGSRSAAGCVAVRGARPVG